MREMTSKTGLLGECYQLAWINMLLWDHCRILWLECFLYMHGTRRVYMHELTSNYAICWRLGPLVHNKSISWFDIHIKMDVWEHLERLDSEQRHWKKVGVCVLRIRWEIGNNGDLGMWGIWLDGAPVRIVEIWDYGDLRQSRHTSEKLG